MTRVKRIQLFMQGFSRGFAGKSGNLRTKARAVGWYAGCDSAEKFKKVFGKYPREVRAECIKAGMDHMEQSDGKTK